MAQPSTTTTTRGNPYQMAAQFATNLISAMRGGGGGGYTDQSGGGGAGGGGSAYPSGNYMSQHLGG